MKICILDAKTLGNDIDLSPIKRIGEVTIYDLTEPNEVAERIKDAEVVITNKVRLNDQNLKEAKSVKLIALFATGFNNIDLEHAKENEIAVVNVAGYSTKSVAQHTFALLFNLLENLAFYDDYVKTKKYTTSKTFSYIEKPFYEIANKTWGIIGMGAIGKEVAKIAEAFGAHIIYYSTSGYNHNRGYRCVDLETLLKESDIVSIHAPLNEKTQNLIGYEEISRMKRNAILMNLGRGGIIEEEGLARALKEECIRGAALDVLNVEPIKDENPLYEVDSSKWIVTPHIAWASVEARRNLIEEVVMNIEAFFKGEIRNRII